MDSYRCHPVSAPLDATVVLPGSKSITNRALITAALADGTSLLTGALLAEDTRLMINALRELDIAVTIDQDDNGIEVTGCHGHIPREHGRLDCGNAGTVMRFCAALTALGHGRYELDGTPRMRERPIGELADALRALGAGVEYTGEDGYPPLTIHAKGLRGGEVALRSPASSQFVSAILLVTPLAMRDVLIDVTGAVPSVPYLKITAAVMQDFGVSVVDQYEANRARFIVPAPQRYRPATHRIEPDASNASYFLAAPAVAGGRLTVEGLGTNSIQGDVGFVDVLEQMGCTVQRHPDRLSVTGPAEGQPLRGVDVDLNHMPDTVQTLAVIASLAEGPTMIRNVGNLRIKETDRLTALNRELTKLGATVEESADSLRIIPPNAPVPAELETYNDHRMAMSFAVLGLKCPGLVIKDPDCCAKTFPDFFERFEKLTTGAS
ncbi:MAG: 3-phosphoshikimate 1-carboxyvinyltransferase [Phycisphaerae bacterium]|jgi:3-phosphoshikimate 1-carboxyvinyltransferase